MTDSAQGDRVMDRSPRLRLAWLAAFVAANTLVACGGGDDGPAPVEPQPATNLADCHNPSMYTVGSWWSIAYTQRISGGGTSPGMESAVVSPPPTDWGMPPGTVALTSWNGGAAPPSVIEARTGIYVRVNDGAIDTLLTANWVHFSSGEVMSYRGYVPGLRTPVSLGEGETYQSPLVRMYNVLAYPPIDQHGQRGDAPPPPLDGGGELVETEFQNQLTYVGREAVTVPAGTFKTCHTISRVVLRNSGATDGEMHEWRVAEGPYKGLKIKWSYVRAAQTSTSEVEAIQADWK